MPFRIVGLPPEPFRPLFALDPAELGRRMAQIVIAGNRPGYPCRVTLDDAEPGERLVLVNYCHQPASTPYRASHAIFVRETAGAPWDRVGDVPPALARRTLSLRAFDATHAMVDAALVEGHEAAAAIERLFGRSETSYLHAHYAARGCFAARVERV